MTQDLWRPKISRFQGEHINNVFKLFFNFCAQKYFSLNFRDFAKIYLHIAIPRCLVNERSKTNDKETKVSMY